VKALDKLDNPVILHCKYLHPGEVPLVNDDDLAVFDVFVDAKLQFRCGQHLQGIDIGKTLGSSTTRRCSCLPNRQKT
jgi:hypothetical protein